MQCIGLLDLSCGGVLHGRQQYLLIYAYIHVICYTVYLMQHEKHFCIYTTECAKNYGLAVKSVLAFLVFRAETF